MFAAHLKRVRLVWYGILFGLFALLVAVKVPAVLAADFFLNWSQIGFVDGTSSLQTFTNVSGSGVNMTTEFRVLNGSFQDIGPYIPGSTALNQGMPKPVNGALAVRDISTRDYPGADVGYVLTKIVFSQGVEIHDLWLESFYDWSDENVRKHLALQAFDDNGNALVPVSWTINGVSSLLVEPQPDNGDPWLRSSYPDGQNVFTGASEISYGNQAVRELHWYSWGYADDNTLSHLLGSTYLGDFQFSTIPTAVSLVSVSATGEPGALNASAAGFLLVTLASLTALLLARRQLLRRA
jgi:hypothetical protein